MNEEIKVNDLVYFKRWWCHSDVFAKVIETDGQFFRLWFPNSDLEKENLEYGEWFKTKHVDSVFRKII